MIQKKYLPLLIAIFLTVNAVIEIPASQQEERKKSSVADKAFSEAVDLQKQGTADSLNDSIEKFQTALSLYQAIGDRSGEAKTLNNIGFVYYLLGDGQEAFDYFN